MRFYLITENYSNLEDLSEIYNTTIVKDITGKLSSLSVNNLGYVPSFLQYWELRLVIFLIQLKRKIL